MIIVPGIDTARLLAAIADVETAGRKNNWPRIEVSFMPKGVQRTVQGHILTGTGTNVNAVVKPRWDQWDMASAASYGPWQILYHTAADRGYPADHSPWLLMQEEISEAWVLRQLAWLQARGADTVAKLADAWNSGTHRDSIVPHEYIAKVVAAYQHG